MEGSYSPPHPIRAGVPQGSVLSPILFSLFTNDIPKIPQVHYALFADDTAIYTTSIHPSVLHRRLQDAINELGRWFRLWRIEVNPEKSAAVLFCRKLSLDWLGPSSNTIRLYDSPIPWANEVKYLGVVLDRRLLFRKHIQRVRNRAAFILGRLYTLLNKRSKLSLRNKLTIYKTCVRPILTYASVVFAHANSTALYQFQVLQNRFLRRAVGAPWYMRNLDLHYDLGLPTVAKFMKDASRRFFNNAPHHPNPLLRSAVNYVPLVGVLSRLRRPRHVLTDTDDSITAALAAREEIRRPPVSQGNTSLSPYTPQRLLRRRRRRPPARTTRGRSHIAPVPVLDSSQNRHPD